jgi:hypothetical protein
MNRPSTWLKGPVKVHRTNSAGHSALPYSNWCSGRCTAGYSWGMTVREMLRQLQLLPQDAGVLAFEAGCEEYCEREVDQLEWQGGRVYLHLGVRGHDLLDR